MNPPLAPVDDRVERHPETAQGAAEDSLDLGTIPGPPLRRLEKRDGVPAQLRQPSQADGLRDHALKLTEIERLDHVRGDSVLDALHGGLDRRVAGDEDDRNIGVALPHRAQELDAVDTGHRDVGDDGVELFPVYEIQGRMPVGRGIDSVAGRLQDAPEGIQEERFVIGD